MTTLVRPKISTPGSRKPTLRSNTSFNCLATGSMSWAIKAIWRRRMAALRWLIELLLGRLPILELSENFVRMLAETRRMQSDVGGRFRIDHRRAQAHVGAGVRVLEPLEEPHRREVRIVRQVVEPVHLHHWDLQRL